MGDADIKEMLKVMGFGETPPEGLMHIVNTFKKRKCAMYPMTLTESDVVTAKLLYDICEKVAKATSGLLANARSASGKETRAASDASGGSKGKDAK